VLGRKYPRTFKLALLDKDVGIARQIVEENGLESPFIELAAQLFREAHSELGEDADHVEAVRVIEQRAGVRIS
jgi:3-hydroxyisobutyrate dehydrogenase